MHPPRHRVGRRRRAPHGLGDRGEAGAVGAGLHLEPLLAADLQLADLALPGQQLLQHRQLRPGRVLDAHLPIGLAVVVSPLDLHRVDPQLPVEHQPQAVDRGLQGSAVGRRHGHVGPGDHRRAPGRQRGQRQQGLGGVVGQIATDVDLGGADAHQHPTYDVVGRQLRRAADHGPGLVAAGARGELGQDVPLAAALHGARGLHPGEVGEGVGRALGAEGGGGAPAPDAEAGEQREHRDQRDPGSAAHGGHASAAATGGRGRAAQRSSMVTSMV
ncbi:hypothetical protein [Barrientosiimonas endolithica]|uniref:hypothetical protein n=1 Tax=Barrientosiimonas endolithica TaxID=1535208 RepID=UPI00259B1794|nr:hypothetical protein [Barrientosiimonas endolithica]